MALRKDSLLGLAISLVVTFTGQSAIAFSINFSSNGRFDAFIYYDEYGYEGEAYLDLPQEIERGGTNELWQLLNDFSSRYPGRWEFRRAENDLRGSFDLLNYYAQTCRFQGRSVMQFLREALMANAHQRLPPPTLIPATPS